MKKNKLLSGMLLFSLLLMLSSCYSDGSFLLSFDDSSTDWNSSLSEIIKNNKTMLSENNIVLESVHLLKDVELNSEAFFSGESGYFPVYTKKDSVFEIISYDNMLKDESCTYNFNISAVNKKIEKLLENKENYNVVQLTWKFDNDTFNSIALFDKKTGELEYDNILFNVVTISKLSSKNFAEILSRSENVFYNDQGSDYVSFEKNNVKIAHVYFSWGETGHWIRTPLYQNSIIIGYSYTYIHDFLSYNFDVWAITNNPSIPNGATLGDLIDLSSINTYSFKYVCWAGYETAPILQNFSLYMCSDGSLNDDKGVGHIATISESPTRPNEYF